ncbi:MAG: pyridoxamine 5'-phosphate oxidase family protein [Chitinophagaceae bacterium]
MGDIKTLTDTAAIEKIKGLAENKICMFCTYEDYQMVSRPMATSGIDEDGTLWFFSRKSSDKNNQLDHNQQVDLIYMDPGKQHYLALSGVADVVYDDAKAHQYWSAIDKAWFDKGLEDPELTMIKVIPSEGHYWDTKNGKLISMLKIAAAVVTGKEMDGGIEGDILP